MLWHSLSNLGVLSTHTFCRHWSHLFNSESKITLVILCLLHYKTNRKLPHQLSFCCIQEGPWCSLVHVSQLFTLRNPWLLIPLKCKIGVRRRRSAAGRLHWLAHWFNDSYACLMFMCHLLSDMAISNSEMAMDQWVTKMDGWYGSLINGPWPLAINF